MGLNLGEIHFTPSVFGIVSRTLQFLKVVFALGFRASCICHLDRIVRTIDEDCCGLDPTEVVHFELQW